MDANEPKAAPGGADPYEPLLRAQEAFEFAPYGEVRTDDHGVIWEVNHAAALLLRCPKQFLAGKPLGLFVARADRGRFYERLARLRRGTAGDAFEARFARHDGGGRDLAVAVAYRQAGGAGPVVFHWRLADVTERKRAEAERDLLLRRLVTAQEDERRRVARELHDSVGQLLTALTLEVRAARDAAPLPPATDRRLAEVQRVADELGRTVRDLAVRLRPTALDDVGLSAALAQHLADWSARTGVTVDYEAAAAEAVQLPADIATAVYRLVQEALTNVARHAHARRVCVALSRHESHLTVAVEDDGVGFNPEAPAGPGRLGLRGMREWAASAGGALEVESFPGIGTTVLARFPVSGAGRGADD